MNKRDSKAPSFQFYPKQWLGDDVIMLMDWDAQGMHFHLLCISWQQSPPCSLPHDPEVIRKWLHNPDTDTWNRVWPQIEKAWLKKGGRLWQMGLLRQWRKQEDFRKKQKQNAEKRWKNQQNHDDAVAMPRHSHGNARAGNALQSSSSLSLTPDKKQPTARPSRPAPDPNKPYLKPDPQKDPLGALICVYKVLRGYEWNDRSWDRIHQPRARAAAKLLFEEVCSKNLKLAHDCMVELAERFKSKALDWNFQTIVKHGHDWVRERRIGEEKSHVGAHDRKGVSVETADRAAEKRTSELRKVSAAGAVFAGVRNLPSVQPEPESPDRTSDPGDASGRP